MKHKKRKSSGSFFKKLHRDKSLKSVKSKIRKKKMELKKLSGLYRKRIKIVSKKLKRK